MLVLPTYTFVSGCLWGSAGAVHLHVAQCLPLLIFETLPLLCSALLSALQCVVPLLVSFPALLLSSPEDRTAKQQQRQLASLESQSPQQPFQAVASVGRVQAALTQSLCPQRLNRIKLPAAATAFPTHRGPSLRHHHEHLLHPHDGMAF